MPGEEGQRKGREKCLWELSTGASTKGCGKPPKDEVGRLDEGKRPLPVKGLYVRVLKTASRTGSGNRRPRDLASNGLKYNVER